MNFNFDTIAQNTSASDVVKITNTGKSTLTIRKIESSMPSLTYKITAMTIEPGQTVNLTWTFKAQSRRNGQDATLDIITNSPNNPEQTIRVKGYVQR